MALQAERAHIRQIAFAASLNHGYNVIGIPERLAAAQSPGRSCPGARRASQFFHMPELGNTVSTADCADSAVSLQHSFAQMTRIAAELPFFHAPFRTKGEPALWNF